jgi:hypothetical protein
MSERHRLTEAALEAARKQGCTCEPEITLTGGDPVWRATVGHDDWCPLFRSNERSNATVPTGPVVFVPPGWTAGQP